MAFLLHQFIYDCAKRTPDAPALLFRQDTLSYRMLEETVNQVASGLRSLGIERDQRVAVALSRTGFTDPAIAADTLSGEKERGTLETLLTTAAGRSDIVRSKMLAVIAVGLAVAVINLANPMVYFGIGVLELPPDFAVAIAVRSRGLKLGSPPPWRAATAISRPIFENRFPRA